MGANGGITIEWKVNNFDKVLAQLDQAIDLGLDTWAADTIQLADSAAPVRTGGLRASRYRVSSITDEFASAVGAFMAANPKGEAAQHPGEAAHGVVIIGFAAGYAAAVDQGHHTRGGSFVAANPFFTSTVEAQIPRIPESLANAFKKVIG